MSLTSRLKQAGKVVLPFILAGTLLNPLNAQQPKNQEKSDWLYHVLEASFIAFNVVDYVTTQQALEYGAQEKNPIAKHFIHNRPVSALWKIGCNLTSLYACKQIKKTHPKLAYASLIGLNLLYGQLAYRNININLKFNLNK